jgi:alkylation response protein AidB-like acyl-CoA dehydrogenase
MNFEFSSEEIEQHKAFRSFCQEEIAPSAELLDRQARKEADEGIRKNILSLARRNYTGINLPAVAGGMEKPFLFSLPFHEQLGYACPSTFIAVEASSGMAGKVLSSAGTAEQKEKYVRGIVSGSIMASFAVTEPDAGSDISDIQTSAVMDNGSWVLNGKKTMITNAPCADAVLVLARTAQDAGDKSFTFFIVPRETPGMSFGAPVETMGLRGASLGDITFTGCRIPGQAAVGAAGSGYALYQKAMTESRIRFAALSAGISMSCLDLSLKHSVSRKISGKAIFKNQEVSFKLADMQAMIDTSRLLARYAAWLYDNGDYRADTLASCAKLFASESAAKIVHMAQQIFGGCGFLKGNAVERMYRDVRFCEIGGGTSEVQRVFIAGKVFGSF